MNITTLASAVGVAKHGEELMSSNPEEAESLLVTSLQMLEDVIASGLNDVNILLKAAKVIHVLESFSK